MQEMKFIRSKKNKRFLIFIRASLIDYALYNFYIDQKKKN